MNLPIKSNSQDKTDLLINFWQKFDKFLIENGKKNCLKWFGESNQIKYKSIIRNTTIKDDIFENGAFKLKTKEKFRPYTY